MIERLPYYYQKSQVTKDFYSVIQNILDKMAAGISTEDLRLFITTTDSFPLHERDVGLSETASDSETKRARVIARLQGNNLLTVEELKRLVRLYTNADCTVAEDYPHYTITILFSEYKGVPANINEIKAAIDGCIIEGYKGQGHSREDTYVTALRFTENGSLEFSGIDDWLVLKNVVISASVTDAINPIFTSGAGYGYTPFRMDGVTISIEHAPVASEPNPFIIGKDVEIKNCIINYSLRAKTSGGEFTEGIYTLIQCKSINIDRSTIKMYNYETNANVKPQFVVNAENGNVHNCKITTEAGMYPAPQGGVNFFCCGISVRDCSIDLLLKNHTLCSDLTSALRGKNCVFCNNVVEHCYNALNYGVISGNVFRRKSLAPPEEKIDVYCDAVITGNRFDKPSFDFHGHKILFSNNMLDNPLVNTEFPSGSINENNLISS